MRKKHEENPVGATVGFVLGGILVGGLAGWLAYPLVMTATTNATQVAALGLPAPGAAAVTYGSFQVSTAANGQTLVVVDNSTASATTGGTTYSIPVSSLSGSLTQGTLATTNTTYTNIVANINNAAGSGATTGANGQVTPGTSGLPRMDTRRTALRLGQGQLNAQLG